MASPKHPPALVAEFQGLQRSDAQLQRQLDELLQKKVRGPLGPNHILGSNTTSHPMSGLLIQRGFLIFGMMIPPFGFRMFMGYSDAGSANGQVVMTQWGSVGGSVGSSRSWVG